MTQFFVRPGEEREQKVFNAFDKVGQTIELALNSFYEGVYGCVPMGEFLFDNELVPLTNAIKRDVFIQCFKEIFEAWRFTGTFESYLLVFRKIFGDSVIVDFTVPGPGRLQIDIEATNVLENNFVARRIEDNAFVFDNVLTQDGDQIVFISVAGMETTQEVETMLFTMVPNGIFTEVSLTLT